MAREMKINLITCDEKMYQYSGGITELLSLKYSERIKKALEIQLPDDCHSLKPSHSSVNKEQ